MPLVPPTATPIDANELRALQRHVIGLLSLRDGGPPLLVLELTDAAGEARPYVLSITGAVQLATDLNGVLEGDEALRALVKESFALARDLKSALVRTDAPPRDHGPEEA